MLFAANTSFKHAFINPNTRIFTGEFFNRLLSGVALLGSIFLAVATAKSAETPDDWRLVWSDEFDGHSLDLSKWEFVVDARGGGNKELQYYVTKNVRVRDGFLTIEASKEHHTGTGRHARIHIVAHPH